MLSTTPPAETARQPRCAAALPATHSVADALTCQANCYRRCRLQGPLLALGQGEWVAAIPCGHAWCWCAWRTRGDKATPPSVSVRAPGPVPHNARSAKAPWLLVACIRLANLPARKLVRLCRQSMQIEESFRDLKSQHFGERLECSHSRWVGRFTVWVLIASLAAFVLWLLGTAAERCGCQRWLHRTA